MVPSVRRHDIHHDGTQHNDTQHNGLVLTLSIYDIQNDGIECHYHAEGRVFDCFADCRYAKCHHAECHGNSIQ